jgi:predicted DNA-binding protein YlxM (UPF0122 family)
MENPLGEKIRINELYDAYGALLTEKQRRYVEYYYRDDYSLSEIAGLVGVSRNAVHEQLGIAATHMEDYETVLGLVAVRKVVRQLVERLEMIGVDDVEVARIVRELGETE